MTLAGSRRLLSLIFWLFSFLVWPLGMLCCLSCWIFGSLDLCRLSSMLRWIGSWLSIVNHRQRQLCRFLRLSSSWAFGSHFRGGCLDLVRSSFGSVKRTQVNMEYQDKVRPCHEFRENDLKNSHSIIISHDAGIDSTNDALLPKSSAQIYGQSTPESYGYPAMRKPLYKQS